MLRNNERSTTSKGETWSRETNSRLPFDVNVMINLSIIQIRDLIELTTSLTLGDRVVRVFKLSSRALDKNLSQ